TAIKIAYAGIKEDCEAQGADFRLSLPTDSIVLMGTLAPNVCYDTKNPYVGVAASDVKAWLMQHSRGVDKSRINCLDTKFSEDLKAFMESNPMGVPTITGAYRSTAEQEAIIRGGKGTQTTYACQSYHPWGLAVDFN